MVGATGFTMASRTTAWRSMRMLAWGRQKLARTGDDILATLEAMATKPPPCTS